MLAASSPRTVTATTIHATRAKRSRRPRRRLDGASLRVVSAGASWVLTGVPPHPRVSARAARAKRGPVYRLRHHSHRVVAQGIQVGLPSQPRVEGSEDL